MARYLEKKCPKCKQRLRIPENVGGVTMICPSCGNKMVSDFKIDQTRSQKTAGVFHIFLILFELPGRFLDHLMKRVFPR